MKLFIQFNAFIKSGIGLPLNVLADRTIPRSIKNRNTVIADASIKNGKHEWIAESDDLTTGRGTAYTEFRRESGRFFIHYR